MSGSSLTDSQLRSFLRRICEQVDGPVEPQYIESIGPLTHELFVDRFGSLAHACLEAGCEYVVETPRPRVYAAGSENTENRTQLIENLRRIVQESDLRPTAENFNLYGELRHNGTHQVFGSWDAMVLEAGLDPTEIPGYVSPTAVADELQRLADRIGAPPSYEFAVEYGAIEADVYDTRFPLWDVALQSAELDPERVDTARELITGLEILAGELGHRPTETEIEQYTNIEVVTLYEQFGSIEEALTLADVPAERDLTPSGSLTDPVDTTAEIPSHTNLLRDIFTVKRRYTDGKTHIEDPKEQRKAFEDRGVVDEKHYDIQFGSLLDAFEYASQIDARKYRSPREPRIGDVPPQLLSEHAQELGGIFERRPLIDEVVALTDHSLDQYLDEFSSWDSVFDHEQVGDGVEDLPNVVPTNAELLESIEQVGVTIEKPPTPTEYRELGYFPVESVLRRYGSWPTMLRAIGVEVDEDIPDEYFAAELTMETVQRATKLVAKQFDYRTVLADDLYRIAFDLGIVPKWDDVKLLGAWPYDAYRNEFEDVSTVVSNVDSVGGDGLKSGEMRSQLLSDLQEVNKLTGDHVWPREIAFFGRYTIHAYLAVFDNLNNAFTDADLDMDHLPRTITSWDDAWDPIFVNARRFLESLREEYEKTGNAPTMAGMNDAGVSAQQCYEYFETWRDALLAAGVPTKKRSPRPSGTKEELKEELQRLADELGHPPNTKDVDKHGQFGPNSYYKYYSNWQSALRDAGVIKSTSPTNTTHNSSNAETEPGSDIVNQLLTDIEKSLED